MKYKIILLTSICIFSSSLAGTISYAEEEILPEHKTAQELEIEVGRDLYGPKQRPEKQHLVHILNATYATNPTLQAARSELRAVQEQLPQALSGWLPIIEANATIQDTNIRTRPYNSADGSFEKELSVNFTQPIYSGGITSAQTSAARDIIRSQIASLISLEQDILLETVTAYMNIVRDRAILDLRKNNRDVLAKQYEATNDRFEVGEVTTTDVEQSKARLAEAKSLIIDATATLRASEAQYERLTGMRPTNTDLPYFNFQIPHSLDEAILTATKNHPRIYAAIHAQKAAEKDIDGIFGELLPQLSLNGSLAKSYDPSPGLYDDERSGVIGITATIPLYKAGNVRSRVRQAKHTANQRYLSILEIKRAITEEAVTAWENLHAATASEDARNAQIKASTIARDGVEAENEFGSRTILDVLDAEQELLNAQVEQVRALRNKIVAQFTLLSIIGMMTPEGLGFADTTTDYHQYLEDFKFEIFNMDVDRVGER